jgi:hypothetical protein
MVFSRRAAFRRSYVILGLLGFLGHGAVAPLVGSAAPSATVTTLPSDARKAHLAFAAQFKEFEESQVNDFWRCLFGRDGDGRRFNSPEQLNAMLESALFADYRVFPGKVTEQCVPKLAKAARGASTFNPPPPPEYRAALNEYGKTLAALGTAIEAWATRAPKRVESKQREQKVSFAGEEWSTTANPAKANPDAWRYDKFLHCAVPNLDNLKDSQALLELLASKCAARKGQPTDVQFFAKLRDTCIPEAQVGPTKAPGTFKPTFDKFVQDFDRLAQAWGFCFRQMNKEAKQDELMPVDRDWEQAFNASTALRKLIAGNLPDTEAAPGPAPRP